MKKIWVSLVTPFNDDLTFDAVSAKKYIEFLDKYDFEGFLLAGSVGEGLLLELHEIEDYIKIIRSVSSKKIMCGVIEFNYINASKKLNLDCDILLVTPPIYFKPHKAAIINYVKQIAQNTDKKIMLYNNPGRVGVNCTHFNYAPKKNEKNIVDAMNFDVYDELYKVENIIGVKECEDTFSIFMKEKYPKWDVLTGNDDVLSYDLISGAVSTLANIVPTIANQDWASWNELCTFAYSIPNPIAVKLVLSSIGIMKPNFRVQFNPLPDFKFINKFVENNSLIWK